MLKTDQKCFSYWQKNLYKKINTKFLVGKTILDVGCGDGQDSYFLSKIVKKVFAFDINKDDAWSKYKMRRIKFQVGDAHKIPYENNRFDGLFVKNVLHHVESPEIVMEEIDRVTKKGAHIDITF